MKPDKEQISAAVRKHFEERYRYESPIALLPGEIETRIVKDGENEVVKALQKIDIHVNREELIRALMFDRNQYEQGFADGCMLTRWTPVTEKLPQQSGKYLVTVQNGNVYAGTFDKTSGRFHERAIAWMPLPTPYTPEEE